MYILVDLHLAMNDELCESDKNMYPTCRIYFSYFVNTCRVLVMLLRGQRTIWYAQLSAPSCTKKREVWSSTHVWLEVSCQVVIVAISINTKLSWAVAFSFSHNHYANFLCRNGARNQRTF